MHHYENVFAENQNCIVSVVTSILTRILFYITFDGHEKKRGKKTDFLWYCFTCKIRLFPRGEFASKPSSYKKGNIFAQFVTS